MSDTIHLDDSAAMVIEQMIEIAEEEDTKAIVMGLSGTVEKNIRSLDILRRVPEDCIVGNLDEAREVARKIPLWLVPREFPRRKLWRSEPAPHLRLGVSTDLAASPSINSRDCST